MLKKCYKNAVKIFNEKSVDELIDEKLIATEEQIMRETNKGRFPILGYSYYLYAKDLKKSDKVSALIYAELGLEIGESSSSNRQTYED